MLISGPGSSAVKFYREFRAKTVKIEGILVSVDLKNSKGKGPTAEITSGGLGSYWVEIM